MATKHTGGIAHLTVVPENFDPDEGSDADTAAAADREPMCSTRDA